MQSQLRNGLTAEKTIYVDNQSYTADPATLKQIEPSLDWGGKLKVVVGDADAVSGAVVCLSEASPSGTVYAIADVASGSDAGTYYAKTVCPPTIDDTTAAALGSTTGW